MGLQSGAFLILGLQGRVVVNIAQLFHFVYDIHETGDAFL
jgi:hypothetical protein